MVLGPEKLPRLVSEVGRWVGRARVMARQFRDQLEEEVQLEEARKAQAAAPPPPDPPPAPTAAAPAAADAAAPSPEAAPQQPMTPHPDTYSHAHPTDESGADPAAMRGSAVDERRT